MEIRVFNKIIKQFGIKGLTLRIFMKMGFIDKSTVYEHDVKVFYSKLTKTEQKEYMQKQYEKAGLVDDIENPVTFTGKIQWMKFNEDLDIRARLADKYAVREWIADKIGSEYLIPIIGVWNRVEDIDFNSLPNKFVFKANHGSGMNYVVKDKQAEDWNKLKKLLQKWLDTSFGWNNMELQYDLIPRKIIAENYIEQIDGNLLDYKVHCFNGKPEFIQVIGDRNLVTHTGKQVNYDTNWNRLHWIFEDYPAYDYDLERPPKLEDMLEISRELSDGFDYVRVDLYIIGDFIKFGEMTFTPASGIYRYKGTWTRNIDLELGKLIEIGV